MDHEILKINNLPSIDEVKKRSQGLALLDAIIMPEWEHRYFSFNGNWDGCRTEMMASMRDGSGDEYFLHFSEKGAVGKVLYGNKMENVSPLLSSVPNHFSGFKQEAAFNLNNTTFYFWRNHGDETWSVLLNDLKSYALLGFLVGGVLYYHGWAEEYYDRKINLEMLKDVFNTLGINSKQLEILNPELNNDALSEDILEIFGKP